MLRQPSLFLATALLATTSALCNEQPTARQIITDIQKQVGVPWRAETVDTFKAGDPDTPVTGIAVTMMATLDVLERAAAGNANLVITHEPTFYSHLDSTTALAAKNDPVLAQKEQFIQDHHMVVWRFHDHWHLRNPDGILTGMVKALGWQQFQSPTTPSLFTVPAISLEALAAELQRKLQITVLRAVGDQKLRITQIALLPGAAGAARQIELLERPDVQALVIGETQEWETVEYAADAATEHKSKGLIILSHIPSEQAGMEECTAWLKTFITTVPIQFVPARQPFWAPSLQLH